MRADGALTRAGALALLLAVSAGVAHAQNAPAEPSPQELKRRKLLDGLGLEKKPAAPAAPAPPTRPIDMEKDVLPAEIAGPSGRPDKPRAAAAPSFRRSIHALLVQGCQSCHSPAGPAVQTRLVLSGDAATDHAAALRTIDRANPAASPLLLKAAGQTHAGGAPWPPESAQAARVLAWLRAGARLDGEGRAPAPAIGTTPSRPATAPARPITTPAPPSVPTYESSPQPSSAPEATTTSIAPTSPGPTAVEVHASLVEGCVSCHSARGLAAATGFLLSGQIDADLAGVRSFLDEQRPERSLLVTKAAGETHAGGVVFPMNGARYQQLVAWVGARSAMAPPDDTRSADDSAPSEPNPAEAAPATTTPVAPRPADARIPHAGSPYTGHAISLPFGLALNGRFSLDVERQRFTGSPASNGAVNALRSHHHFLFLSRESPQDRFGITLEMLNLLYWEAHLRLSPRNRPWQVGLAAGKIMVPFGADPLFHQSYGGLAGFDQRMLPVFWAREGLAVRFVAQRRELVITDDLYVVRGYALRRGDATLNLQGDFSPDDDAKLGWGNRLGISWGPLSAWYSSYFNLLGFDRHLFMQAADVTLWRARSIPVLRYFSLGAGLIRADVSGGEARGFGGPGRDYYHFGSYFQLRAYPRDWLYLQYRQGVRTFDNRRGVITDETRLTHEDASAHNFAVVARYHGLTVGLFYFINLEKGTEVPNDVLRGSMTFEF